MTLAHATPNAERRMPNAEWRMANGDDVFYVPADR
jgi:hypothetical protein